MTQHDDSASLHQMLDHSREAMTLVQGRSRKDLDRERVLTLALCRLAEIIGEAANRVSQRRRERHPEIPWPQIIGLRDRLIHGYDSINHDMLWQILTVDLPSLTTTLSEIVEGKDAGREWRMKNSE